MTNIRKESRRNGFAVLLQLAAIICTAAAAYAQTNNAFSLSAEVGGKNATNLFCDFDSLMSEAIDFQYHLGTCHGIGLRSASS